MNPRRLLPLLIIFLGLVGTYNFLQWYQGRKDTREREAKKIFAVKETDITALTLKKGREEIILAKGDKGWEIRQPLAAKADQVTVDSLLTTLARLEKSRDLGEIKELKAFGLDQPGLAVEFTAQGQPHRLLIGAKTPGEQGYYAQQEPGGPVLLIASHDKESLDRPLPALRDKELLAFKPEQVKAIQVKAGKTMVNLEKTGPTTWRLSGRPDFRVRRDRVEALVRRLHLARAKDFVADAPKEVRAYGLGPQAAVEVTLVLDDKKKESLLLGARKENDLYARKGAGGPVVLVDQDLLQQINRNLSGLEDKRLWSGDLTEVQKVVWGAPPKLWTAVREKDGFKLTGPEKQEVKKSAAQVELALIKFQEIEAARYQAKAGAPEEKPVYTLELSDGAGKLWFSLGEGGQRPATGKEIAARLRRGDETLTALVPQEPYVQWQAEMNRLTEVPRKTEK